MAKKKIESSKLPAVTIATEIVDWLNSAMVVHHYSRPALINRIEKIIKNHRPPVKNELSPDSHYHEVLDKVIDDFLLGIRKAADHRYPVRFVDHAISILPVLEADLWALSHMLGGSPIARSLVLEMSEKIKFNPRKRTSGELWGGKRKK